MDAKTVVFVTGASSGFGKACAEYLSQKGFKVYGTSRNDWVEYDSFTMLKMDVNDLFSIENAVDTIIKNEGKIDVLINNAGVGISGAIELTDYDELDYQFKTNFYGLVSVCKAVLPYMHTQKRGKIINISSIAGLQGVPFQAFYSASKFAVEGYSEALSMEIAPFGIKVVVIEPGDFNTGFTNNRHISKETLCSESYSDVYKNISAIFEFEEKNGLKADLVSKKVYEIINKNNPKFRYIIGNFIQKISVFIQKILPYNLYRKLLMSYYKIK